MFKEVMEDGEHYEPIHHWKQARGTLYLVYDDVLAERWGYVVIPQPEPDEQ